MRLPELPEHEARYIRDYVNSQSQDDEAGLVQKVGSRRVMGRVHDMYDVHCERSRWWVITEPTNLYLQDDFPEVEQALIFHLGLGIFMAERSRAELPEAEEERVSGAWRRFKQALSDMDDAGHPWARNPPALRLRHPAVPACRCPLGRDGRHLHRAPHPIRHRPL